MATPSATPGDCAITFEDVHPSDWFYQYVQYMYCHNVIAGYNTDPPCSDPGATCFKPYNTASRGQLAKIVVRAFALPINTQGGPHFRDVPPGSAFYDYVETGYNLGLWGGYANGKFGPFSLVTRAQITKIIVNTAILVDPAHWTLENPSTNTFQDVHVGSTFFRYVETAASHGVISGYACGSAAWLPCVPPQNKPYFVPYANPTRAQISKITYLTINYGH
jgi:N-acetylmuramoyl-L-alanine amidase